MKKFGTKNVGFDFETVKFLKSTGYQFDKQASLKTGNEQEWKALACFGILTYEDFEDSQNEILRAHVEYHDITTRRSTFPWVKQIRKKKIMTVLLCIKRLYPFFQKEIVWNILDLAYSPLNERGL